MRKNKIKTNNKINIFTQNAFSFIKKFSHYIYAFIQKRGRNVPLKKIIENHHFSFLKINLKQKYCINIVIAVAKNGTKISIILFRKSKINKLLIHKAK